MDVFLESIIANALYVSTLGTKRSSKQETLFFYVSITVPVTIITDKNTKRYILVGTLNSNYVLRLFKYLYH